MQGGYQAITIHCKTDSSVALTLPLSLQDFLTHHSLELMGLLSLNYPQLQALSDTVSRAIAPKSQTASNITLAVSAVCNLFKKNQYTPDAKHSITPTNVILLPSSFA